MGKLAQKELITLLSNIKNTPQVVVPPQAGYDSGVHQLDDHHLLVISTDPCIGVPVQWFGWFLIHYSASDVAVFGAKPRYTTLNILAPVGTPFPVFEKIMKQASKTATEIGVDIVTGHTGEYEGITTLTGTSTTYGFVKHNELVTPGGAQPGDLILCTKPLGLETLTNFSLMQQILAEKLFGKKRTQYLARQVKKQTVVQEAQHLADLRCISAMHDATEGGMTAALNEIANASKIGFELEYEKFPILEELTILKDYFHLSFTQELSISSTGLLLVAVPPHKQESVLRTLRTLNVNAKIIGLFKKGKRTIKKDGKTYKFPSTVNDPYSQILSTQT